MENSGVGFDIRLNKCMVDNGVSQADLCRLTGLKSSMISFYCSGQRMPTISVAIKIACALNTTVEYLVKGNDSCTHKIEAQEISKKAHGIGRAYDRADLPVKRTVEVALEPYMEASEELTPEIPKYDEPEMVKMKVYDEPAAAGLGDYLSDDSYEVMSFLASEVPARADFGVRISGNSMEPTIDNGSIAWIQAMPEVQNGDIGIFVLNNSAYCKELYVDAEERRVYLVSHNDDYDDIPINEEDDLRTVGKVLL